MSFRGTRNLPKKQILPIVRMTNLVLEEFFEEHTYYDPQWSAIALSLAECILVVVDIDGNLLEMQVIYSYLIDELTRILHPIHRDPDAVEDRYSHHTISVVSICEMDSGDQRGEYTTSGKYTPTNEWDIGIGLHDEPRSEHYIEGRICIICSDKSWHIRNIMLPISVKCHEIFPMVLGCILSDILESCLECRSGSTVGDMMNEVNSPFSYEISE